MSKCKLDMAETVGFVTRGFGLHFCSESLSQGVIEPRLGQQVQSQDSPARDGNGDKLIQTVITVCLRPDWGDLWCKRLMGLAAVTKSKQTALSCLLTKGA